MKPILHPRAAPWGRARVWLGLVARDYPPDVAWRLDGKSIQPRILRPLQPIRTVAAGLAKTNETRVHSGIYEFDLKDESPHLLEAATQNTEVSARVQSLPRDIPPGPVDSFNVLAASCYHYKTDAGHAGAIISQLKPPDAPHLAILMGDQVYLDLPSNQFLFKKWRPYPLAQRFESDYARNWWPLLTDEAGDDPGRRGVSAVLHRTPALLTVDDHEFWNNYPREQDWIATTKSENGRAGWEGVGRTMVEGFQTSASVAYGSPDVLDVSVLSFFILDTRSFRTEKRLVASTTLDAMESWAQDLIARKRFGVFVCGQLLFREPARIIKKGIDAQLANHEDYERIVGILHGIAKSGLDVLYLSGDVHWGRVVRGAPTSAGRGSIYEIVSSPLSLLDSMYGEDGEIKPKPESKHSSPEDPPDYFAKKYLGTSYRCKRLGYQDPSNAPPKGPHRGEQFVLIGFQKKGSSVQVRARFFSIPGPGSYEVETFTLSRHGG
jgi:hypothetical protein